MLPFKFGPFTALLPLLFGCIAGGASAADIAITEAQIDSLQIRLEEVRPASDEAIALLPATVVPPMNSRIAVTAPFAGTVVSVDVLPGETVEPGRQLMKIASRELVETISQLRQAEANLAAAKAVADRYKGLAEKNITSPTRAAETEAHRAGLAAVVAEHQRLVSLGNIKTEADGSYALIAQRAGRVVEARAAPGGSIEAMAPAVVIDTSDALWVEAQLPAALIGKVRAGDKILLANGGEGKVLSVSHSIDPKTRSAQLTGSIPARDGLVAGQMVTLSIHREASVGGLQVPAAAVVYLAGTPNIFVRTAAGFSVLPVTLKGKSLHAATVEGPLAAGQKVAVSGLAELENMMGGE